MKNIIKTAAAAAVLAAMLVSCGGAQPGMTTDPVTDDGVITTAPTVTERTTRTNSKGVPIPDVLKDGEIELGPEPDSETPITGLSAAAKYHDSHNVLSVKSGSVKSANFSEWHEGRSADALFDGKDGYFSDEANKMGGGVDGGTLTVEFQTSSAVVVGYAFVTGTDSGSYPDRSPSEWTLSGSNDGKNWTVIDYVYDGRIQAANSEYFGYEVDEESRAGYSYYQFKFTLNLYNSPLSSFQLNECYLYTDK